MARATEKSIEVETARLRGLNLPTLRRVWQNHYGQSAPAAMRRELLIRSILWQIQAKAFGDISPAVKKYLGQVAEAAQSKAATDPPPARIRAGTKLIRVWEGRTYTVTVLDDGFEWQGKRHRSLSQIARSITGTRWNGLVFFGVKRPSSAHPGSTALGQSNA